MKKVEIRDLNFNLGDIVRLKFVDDDDFFIGEVICIREFTRKDLKNIYHKTLIKLHGEKKPKSRITFIARNMESVIQISSISKLQLNYSAERDDGSTCA